ncbi:hypothetical protein OG689_37350 [Kitasatospora sp. NBC_00240]|uniref:hypothetical protein n=1 Tax=Kitasatospora sp. NBC_00240 TaxID=2903567 RepID=UPI00224F2D9B|nr:hypothetical protein [Kitasatospora sp. NBC_00240]MCX5214863.1 hypothetical protein [Kitasatospora sp. NBC_00240]
MAHSMLALLAGAGPATGYLAGYLLLTAGAGREPARGSARPGAGLRGTLVLWTMPGFLVATVLWPLPDRTAGAQFFAASAAGAAANALVAGLAGYAFGPS